MIPAERFVVQSTDREAWLAARLGSVTATEVAKAATPSGFVEAVEQRQLQGVVTPNEFMTFGSDNEAWISMQVKHTYGVLPNCWLIEAADNPLHRATPDGLSLDHTRISEVKTGGKESTKPPIAHLRQMQWQMYVTGAEACVYAFMLRREVNGVFVPAWLEPKTQVIERDELMIAELIGVADRLLASDNEREAA